MLFRSVILEPVQNGGGCFVPQDGYFQRVREICDRHGVLLISDEVICAWGRIGHWFGCERYDCQPDILTIAKGLTSAYAPLSGSIVSKRVWDVLERGTDENGPIGHGWTYSAHPIGAAAGVANLKLVDDLGLIKNAREIGAYFLKALRDALGDHPMVGDVRGEGLLAAVELVEDKAARKLFDPARKIGPQVAAALAKRGVVGRAMPQGDILGFTPPLCLSRGEADIVVSATAEAVKEVAKTVGL